MATIIKASGPIRPSDGASFNFDDMTDRANGYLDTMRGQAAEIIAKARQDAETIRRQAEEEGRQAAIRAVEKVMDEKVGKQLATLLPAIKHAAEHLTEAKHAWLMHWERTAVHLAARIAERVIRREISREPQITAAPVKEALEMASGSPEVRILMHPDDVAALGSHLEALTKEIARHGSAQIVADSSISIGGCRIETRFGVIDQQIEAQLQRIEEELDLNGVHVEGVGSRFRGEVLYQAESRLRETDSRPPWPMLTLDQQLDAIQPARLEGRIARVVGMTAAASDLPAPVGAVVSIESQTSGTVEAEVIGFRDDLTLLSLLGTAGGVCHGNRVRLVKTSRWLRVGSELLGRVIDAHGHAIDGKPQPALMARVSLDRKPIPAVDRPRIDTPLATGVRTIDGLLTCGKGQRMGVFAGSGVGKSVMLGMMSRYTEADVNVIALIGERGREVNEFIERDLGKEGLARSVIVVATSDEPALRRIQAAFTATAIAEYFRDDRKDVLLIMDSLTRLALAQREIGLAAGEPPTTRGFPPSVFAMLPRLLERAGRSTLGSITGFYSVLVEGDDPNEPVADTVRGLLDGHTWLSRKLASRGHYPAIDVLESISRLMNDISPPAHLQAAQTMRELLAAYREHEDLISIGAYKRGSNRAVDLSIDLQADLNSFLRQRVEDRSDVTLAREGLIQLQQKTAIRVAA